MTDADGVTRARLLKQIAGVLQSWPLYRNYRYDEGSLLIANPGYAPVFRLPSEISLPCTDCKNEQRWKCGDRTVFGNGGFQRTSYVCKNCEKSGMTYFVFWNEAEDAGSFFKVGQHPPLESDPPAKLKLEADDHALYKKALTSRNFSFGIGALAYLRRVVENQMNRLLDLVADAAKAAEADEQEWSAGLAEAKESRAFDKKVAFAAKILPAHLKPGGHNPFDVLHGFASGGLHAKSDEECLATFDSVQLVFEYLFNQLTVSSEDTKAYADRLAQLASGKPQKKK